MAMVVVQASPESPSVSPSSLRVEPYDWEERIRSAATVPLIVTCEQAAMTFERMPDAPCIVVINERGEPAGLVMRDRFFRKLSRRFGASLYYEKPIERLMEAAPTIVDRGMAAQHLVDLALGRDDRSFYDCVIVKDGTSLAGVLTVADLLAISRTLQSRAMQSQAEIAERTERMMGDIDQAVAAVRQASALGESLSETMVDQTLLGKNELTGVSRAFANLSGRLTKQQEQIDELQRRAQAIGTVSALIRELAESSNLLAVNATIEAARAGEHGRGFAVVAEEVRRLAAATKKSADDIKGLIGGITEAVERTAELAHAGVIEAQDSESAVIRASRAFEQLFHAAADSRGSSRDIDTKAALANDLSARVSADIRRLSDSIRQSSESAGSGVEDRRNPRIPVK